MHPCVRLSVFLWIAFFLAPCAPASAIVGVAPSTPESIRGTVRYEGEEAGSIVVEAFVRADFVGRSVSRSVLELPGTYELKIKSGIYHLRAFVDRNENGRLDEGEPWAPHDPSKALVLPPLSSKSGVDIHIR